MQRPLAAPGARVARGAGAGRERVEGGAPGGRALAATQGLSTSPTAPLSQHPASRLTACSYKRKAGAAPAAGVVRLGVGLAGSATSEARAAEQEIRPLPSLFRPEMQRPPAARVARVARVVWAVTDPVGTAVPGARGLAATPGLTTSPTAARPKQSAPRLKAFSYKQETGAAPAA